MHDTDPTTVACPVCGAPVGVPCQRVALIPLNHNQRIYETEIEDYVAEVRAERNSTSRDPEVAEHAVESRGADAEERREHRHE